MGVGQPSRELRRHIQGKQRARSEADLSNIIVFMYTLLSQCLVSTTLIRPQSYRSRILSDSVSQKVILVCRQDIQEDKACVN